MTERFEITTMLQKEFSLHPEVFGELDKGTPDNPSVTKESVHHFSKLVNNLPLQRPPWFFDPAQQGEAIVDVTTHLVDLVQWECFPEEIIKEGDVKMISAKSWDTGITKEQFQTSHQARRLAGLSETAGRRRWRAADSRQWRLHLRPARRACQDLGARGTSRLLPEPRIPMIR